MRYVLVPLGADVDVFVVWNVGALNLHTGRKYPSSPIIMLAPHLPIFLLCLIDLFFVYVLFIVFDCAYLTLRREGGRGREGGGGLGVLLVDMSLPMCVSVRPCGCMCGCV